MTEGEIPETFFFFLRSLSRGHGQRHRQFFLDIMSRSDPDGNGIWEHIDFAPKDEWYVPPYSGSPDYDYWNSNKRDGEWEDERPWKYQRTDDWYGEWTSDVPFGPEPMPAWYLPDDWEDDWGFQYNSQSPTYQEAENALNAWLNAPVPTYESPIPGYTSPDINWDDAFNQIMDLDYTFRPITPESTGGSPMSWITQYTGDHPDPSAPPYWMDDDWMDWENTDTTSGEKSWMWDLFSGTYKINYSKWLWHLLVSHHS